MKEAREKKLEGPEKESKFSELIAKIENYCKCCKKNKKRVPIGPTSEL